MNERPKIIVELCFFQRAPITENWCNSCIWQ